MRARRSGPGTSPARGARPWPALPPGKDRVPFEDRVVLKGYTALAGAKHSGAPLEIQELGGATDQKHLWFRPTGANAWLEITLTEGRKNQIREVFQRVGYPVLKLKRISIGGISDRGLAPGAWRKLTDAEIRSLKGASP